MFRNFHYNKNKNECIFYGKFIAGLRLSSVEYHANNGSHAMQRENEIIIEITCQLRGGVLFLKSTLSVGNSMETR